jgi:hypothetical protein
VLLLQGLSLKRVECYKTLIFPFSEKGSNVIKKPLSGQCNQRFGPKRKKLPKIVTAFIDRKFSCKDKVWFVEACCILKKAVRRELNSCDNDSLCVNC